jgi:ribose transport system substrate-binding protein
VPVTAFSYNGSAAACAQTAGAKCIFGANPAWLSAEATTLPVDILDGKKPAQRDVIVRANFVTSDPFDSKLFPNAKMEKIEVGKNVFPDLAPGLTLPVQPDWVEITAQEAAGQ